MSIYDVELASADDIVINVVDVNLDDGAWWAETDVYCGETQVGSASWVYEPQNGSWTYMGTGWADTALLNWLDDQIDIEPDDIRAAAHERLVWVHGRMGDLLGSFG